MLQIKNLSLAFEDKYVLKNLSIDFWDNHIHAIVGPNGAGKSTLAHTIMGLEQYRGHEGEIILDDKPLHTLSIDKRAQAGITLAWQEPARFEGVSVTDFIKAAGGAEAEDKVGDYLSMVGLEADSYRNRMVDAKLSGGERKRIELASIIAMRPRLVLMDEPDSGIDIEAIENIFTVIRELKKMGTTVILITHSAEVLKQADHAFLLCHGQLVDKGVVSDMISYFEGKCIPCQHKNEPDNKEVLQ